MIDRLVFYWKTNRLGPDMLSTYPLLFFKRSMRWICEKKFKHFGKGAEVRPGAILCGTSLISIGDNVILRPGVMFDAFGEGTITIEDDVLIGSGVHIYTGNHVFSNPNIPISQQGFDSIQPVRICQGAWVGAGAILLAGVTIGRNSVVGAGSIVTKDVPDHTVVVGNPAKIIKEIKNAE